MTKKQYKTAQGQVLDFDSLMACNEEVISIGNLRVNSRGDELGPGGKIVRTRNQVMQDYYKLHTPTATSATPAEKQSAVKAAADLMVNQGMAKEDADLEPELTDAEIKKLKSRKSSGIV